VTATCNHQGALQTVELLPVTSVQCHLLPILQDQLLLQVIRMNRLSSATISTNKETSYSSRLCHHHSSTRDVQLLRSTLCYTVVVLVHLHMSVGCRQRPFQQHCQTSNGTIIITSGGVANQSINLNWNAGVKEQLPRFFF